MFDNDANLTRNPPHPRHIGLAATIMITVTNPQSSYVPNPLSDVCTLGSVASVSQNGLLRWLSKPGLLIWHKFNHERAIAK